MKKLLAVLLAGTVLTLAACVTINVYFPAAAAEKAAERFVDDVLAEPHKDGALYDSGRSPDHDAEYGPDKGLNRNYRFAPTHIAQTIAGEVLDFLVPSAQAQQASIDIDTPQINAIKARMAERQRQTLAAWFDSGAIGFTADGLVAIRDRAAVPLNERRNLESVVADENRDRKAVYREIAVANGHPEWEQDVQQTFAREWIRSARPGWYYQEANGSWRQK